MAANITWAQVFQDTGNTCSTHNANNVQWYFSDTYSMAFAPVGATVSRGSCDTGGGNPLRTRIVCAGIPVVVI